MNKKRFLAWITIYSILWAFILPYFAERANAMTTLDTNVTTASEDCTILGVYGSYYSQAQDGLDRINEIRKEACEAGNVPDPRQPGRMLTSDDYAPLKWSTDLESIARIRAAEGGLAYSFLSSGHDRLNGKGTFSVSYNGISSIAEDLAYNWGTSMVSGINQWYAEKADWVDQNTGAVTGHYTSMINPMYTYVGLGDFYTEESTYPNTLAGEFSSSSQDLDQTMQDALSDVMQKIEVKNSYITGYILAGDTSIYTDQTTTLTPKANLVNGSKTHTLWVLEPVTYTSSNTSVATITNNGVVTGCRNGETVITAQSGGNDLASITITVKCNHEKELISSILPTCTTEGSNIAESDTIAIKKGTSHKVGSYQYKVTGVSTVSMTGVNNSNLKKITVPKTVKIGGTTFKVTAIASHAFKNNKKITRLQVGNNVETIGASAFIGCTKLTRVTLGTSVTKIGSNAFRRCKKLGTITIPSTNLKSVGKNALKGIKAAAKIKVPAKKLSAYKKLFKNKGQGKKVRITKK